VGDSTTKAVVSAIVLLAFADALFSVIFYFLDL
jgi:ABC-type transporter Mla maintaining outer membrane lipid asymmetry permease subunit MlaE